MTSKKGFNTMAALALVKLEGGEVEFLKKNKGTTAVRTPNKKTSV